MGCNRKSNTADNSQLSHQVKIMLDSIQLDHVNSSYVGNVILFNDTLYFIDYSFGWVYMFNSDGTFLSRTLGQGNGPHEIPIKGISSCCFLPNGDKIFIGSTLDGYLFNQDWNLEKSFFIDRSENGHFTQDHLTPENPFSYTLDYEHLTMRSDPSSKYLFVPVYAEQKNFNPYTRQYYKESRLLEQIDLEDGRIIDLLGRRSPEYLKYHYIGQYAFFSFDITRRGTFYITHEIDSLIYVYNNKFQLLSTFGRSGTMMNTDYIEADHFDLMTFRKLYFIEKPKHGYYSYLEYIDGTGLLFRSYKKSEASKSDGLQIYRNKILIADISVPKDFKVIGYKKPYYYSGPYIDEEQETIKLFRFIIKD